MTNEFIETSHTEIATFKGTYKNINWSIVRTGTGSDYQFKYIAGLRGSGDATTYGQAKSRIINCIDKSLNS